LALLAESVVALAADPAVPAPPDALQVRYLSNLTAGDSVLNITNVGSQGGFEPAGAICANVYAFDPSQALVACCSCYVSPNSLHSLSARADLMSNALTPSVPTSIVVKILASTPVGGTCNAASPTATNLAPGMRASAATLHALPKGGFASAETDCSNVVLSTTELTKLTSYCGFIQAIGSGFGICRSCKTGGLGATKAE
jgi:hypothetical protein